MWQDPIVEDNNDDGFVEASEPSVAEPSAETDRPVDHTEA